VIWRRSLALPTQQLKSRDKRLERELEKARRQIMRLRLQQRAKKELRERRRLANQLERFILRAVYSVVGKEEG